jgi:hypothetical protein
MLIKIILSFILTLLLSSSLLFSQVAVNTDGNAPDSSAMLDVRSSSKGFLPPRMTLDQRNAILNPAEGLIVYCTDCGSNGTLSIFSNGAWRTYTPCISPSSSAVANIVSPGQIIWRWMAVAGAAGYKWSTTNSYSTAFDMGSDTSKTETDIVCDSTYTRSVWAYNSCGVSAPAILAQIISANFPSAPTAGTHVSTYTSIVWNWDTVPDAIGYKWNTTNDFETSTDLGADTIKNEAGLMCDSTYIRYVWAYNGCGYSTPVTLTQSTLECWNCGNPITINHLTTGGVAPVDKTVTYGTVINIPGETSKCWITSNLGANHQATAVNDATEGSAGWYWQFNRMQGYKHDRSTVIPAWTTTSIDENSAWIAANDPCTKELGDVWRIPTNAEWTNVYTNGGWTNWNGPWNSALKLHAAGNLFSSDGSLYNRGSNGHYWSSSQGYNSYGFYVYFSSSYCVMDNGYKADGFSIRCLYQAPTPTVTTVSVSNITQTTAISGGDVTSDNGASVTTRGVCWSTSSNPTISDSHTTDGSGTGEFVSNLNSLTLNNLYFVRAYATNSFGTAYGNEMIFTTLSEFNCGSFTINHLVTGGVAPVDKTVTYGTVTNIPGETSKCWITSNLGSDHQATAVDDATETSAGWYWQFNRMQGYKHDGTTVTPAWTITSINENSDWMAANDPCALDLSNGWRLPVYSEWFNVDASGSWTDWNGPWNSALKLHAAGYLSENDGSLFGRGWSSGYYWSSSQGGNSIGGLLSIGSGVCSMGYGFKAYGWSVRCLRDDPTPIVTTASVTNITETTATSGGEVTTEGLAPVTARGVCWNTSSNPTIEDNYTTDGVGSGYFVSSLAGLTQHTLYFVRAYATNSEGTSYGDEEIFSTTCGFLTINHLVSGGVAPVDKTVTYNTVTNIPGEPLKCWITSNLGADHQATAKDDATEASAGWYWQFNLKQGYKHDGSTVIPAWTITSIVESTDWIAAKDPCVKELGSGWRIPTYTEWNNVYLNGGWTNWNGPWNSSLKMHAAGSLHTDDGSLYFRGSQGFYWSGSQNNNTYGWFLLLYDGNCYTTFFPKGYGLSGRCIKD